MVGDREPFERIGRDAESVPAARTPRDPFGVRRRHGTWRGLARLWLAQFDHATGRTRALGRIDWSGVGRLVFVCRGNICRSAYAERRARDFGLSAASFGLATTTGLPADPAALRAAAARRLDLSAHRTTDVTDFAFRSDDLLLAMERRHVAWLERLAIEPRPRQTTLLGLWSRPARPHLHDPFGLDPSYFDSCFSVIDSAVAAIAAKLRRPHDHGRG